MSEVAKLLDSTRGESIEMQVSTLSQFGFGGKKKTWSLATLQKIQTQTFFHLAFASENKT